MACCRPVLAAAIVALGLLVTSGATRGVGASQSAPPSRSSGGPSAFTVYVGTFTRPGASRGIYALRLDAAAGTLSPAALVAEAPSPSFLAVDATRRFLYAVNEVSDFEGQKAGSVSAFAIDAARGLQLLNRVSTVGPGPTHLAIDRTNGVLLAANYNGGSVVSFPIGPDGRLAAASSFHQHAGSSADARRQGAPHPHQVVPSPDNRFVFIPDLGLDRVMAYRLDAAKAALAPNDPPFAALPPGSGPRHMVFHPNGRFAFVLSELTSTMSAFAYDAARGALKPIQAEAMLPREFAGTSSGGELQLAPGGRFLYGSNRGHDSITVFSVSPDTGAIAPLERIPTGGRTSRFFCFDPTGRYVLVAHQDSNTIALFRFDEKTGHLAPTGVSVEVPSPVCLVFVP